MGHDAGHRVVVRFDPLPHYHAGMDQLAGDGIRNAVDARAGHVGMLVEHALDLEWADQVAGRLDHVVGATDEPERTVGVAAGEVARQIPTVGEALAVTLFVVR